MTQGTACHPRSPPVFFPRASRYARPRTHCLGRVRPLGGRARPWTRPRPWPRGSGGAVCPGPLRPALPQAWLCAACHGTLQRPPHSGGGRLAPVAVGRWTPVSPEKLHPEDVCPRAGLCPRGQAEGPTSSVAAAGTRRGRHRRPPRTQAPLRLGTPRHVPWGGARHGRPAPAGGGGLLVCGGGGGRDAVTLATRAAAPASARTSGHRRTRRTSAHSSPSKEQSNAESEV